MELHVPDAGVAALESALASATVGTQPALQVELAWHLRQRETRRARDLAATAAAYLQGHAADGDRNVALLARARLADAECRLLLQEEEEALRSALAALDAFRKLADAVGEGDAELVQALIAQARGNRGGEADHCRRALECFRRAGAEAREHYARVAGLIAEHLSDARALPAWVQALRARCRDPAVTCQIDYFEGIGAFQHGRYADAIPVLTRARDDAMRMGMRELGQRIGLTIAGAFTNLGDLSTTAHLAEEVLAQARAAGWPRNMGSALGLLARVMIQSGEPARAEELIAEAFRLTAPGAQSRAAGNLHYTRGDALLALGEAERALAELDAAIVIMQRLGQMQEVASLLALRAQALSRLRRPGEALESAAEALQVARDFDAPLWICEALRSLAEIQMSHPGEDAARARAEALACLTEALAVVEEIGGYHEKGELLAEISRVHESAGDLAAALRAERGARVAQAAADHMRAANLALAAQARHETDMARLEASHQRSLAAAEADRAVQLGRWNEQLEQRVSEQVGQLERLMRLKRFLSPKVAEMILAGQLDDPLVTRRREVTIMFVDLRGFTAFSDAAAPEDVLGVLREYHAEVGRLTEKYEGTIEHFAGDGVMLIFNDPAVLPDPAFSAASMALELRDQVDRLARSWERLGYRLHCGIGIAQGYATIGTIGFSGRQDYGVVGHVNNLAARLCAEAGAGQVLVSQRVFGRLEGRVLAEAIGELQLKGFHAPVPAFNILALRESVPIA